MVQTDRVVIVQEKKEERNTFMGLPGQGENPG